MMRLTSTLIRCQAGIPWMMMASLKSENSKARTMMMLIKIRSSKRQSRRMVRRPITI